MGLLCFFGFHAWLEFTVDGVLKRVSYCCLRAQTFVPEHWDDNDAIVKGRWVDDP
jgi:hypothetical protein